MVLDETIIQLYAGRLRGRAQQLMNWGIPPEVANAYAQRFKAESIRRLHRAGISPQEANRFPLDAQTIITLTRRGISWEQAQEYRDFPDYNGRVLTLIQHGISPKVANGYSSKFNVNAVIYFYDNEISFHFSFNFTIFEPI